ncbi:MAG TPA: hypothetical protein V6D21_09230, partial [Candidatus Obscuribacterales bacterium]
MSDTQNAQHEGSYADYGNLLTCLAERQKECPKGVALKLERKKYLMLQFVYPCSGKRNSKSCGVQFTIPGIYEALDKAWKVSDALKRFQTSSEFWDWYNSEILKENKIVNDLKTYREIFAEIEDKFFNGKHRNTGRQRERDVTKPGGISDNKSFHQTYSVYLERFTDLDKNPTWEDIKAVWENWEKGTKSFKDFKTVAIAIAELCPDGEKLLKQIRKVDAIQTKFKDKQSIALDDFLNWYKQSSSEIPSLTRECDRITRESWLWVASMCVMYGLRPSEVAASLNLTESFTKDGVTIYPITDKINNRECTLVIGEFTNFGSSTKTGLRLINPVPLKHLWEQLKIRLPLLPKYSPKPDSKPECIAGGFDGKFYKKLKSYNCPVSQKYAFRHLYNQLLEMSGIGTPIRSRLMGHSETTNTSTYKKRRNLKTELAIINADNRQPLSLEIAKLQIESVGI